MILLDTNVLSALMQQHPDRAVVHWLDGQPTESVWTTSITVFEVRFGLALLADGCRRQRLETAFDEVLEVALAGRVLPFERTAACEAATIAARLRKSGRSVEIRDLEIAGIALAHKAAVATQNARHFEHTGVRIVSPWIAG